MPERAARDMELRLKKALRLFVYSALTLCELERVWLRIDWINCGGMTNLGYLLLPPPKLLLTSLQCFLPFHAAQVLLHFFSSKSKLFQILVFFR